MVGFCSRTLSHFSAARFQRPSGGFFEAGSAKPAWRFTAAICGVSRNSATRKIALGVIIRVDFFW